MTGLMPTTTKVARKCERCGGSFYLLLGAQGGQRIDVEPVDVGCIRIEEKVTRAEVQGAPGVATTGYTLLPPDAAASARESGERLYRWHVCNVQVEPEPGPMTPWRPHERIEP